jgi:hypothetical protein
MRTAASSKHQKHNAARIYLDVHEKRAVDVGQVGHVPAAAVELRDALLHGRVERRHARG